MTRRVSLCLHLVVVVHYLMTRTGVMLHVVIVGISVLG